MTDRPRPTRKIVKLSRLTFDPRLQQRAGGIDTSTVEEYVDAMHEYEGRRPGRGFPPAEAVDDAGTYFVFSGFHRGAAWKRFGDPNVPVLVYPGTFDDAVLWSLSVNATHGRPRSCKDVQRAIATLLDSPRLLDRVLASAGANGGVNRSLAHAAGVSKGAICKALDLRGLHITRTGTIEKKAVEHRPAARDRITTIPASSPTLDAYVSEELADRSTATATTEFLAFDAHLEEAECLLDRIIAGGAGVHLQSVTLDDRPLLSREPHRLADHRRRIAWGCRLLRTIRLAVRDRQPAGPCRPCNRVGCHECNWTGVATIRVEAAQQRDVTPLLLSSELYSEVE